MAGWNTDKRIELATGLAWWLLLAWAAWSYWPGLSGPTLLDDDVNLSPLQVLQTHPEYFRDVIAENTSGPLGRPVSMITFGLEHLAGQGDPRTGKYHNLLLHLLNGSVVFWLLYLLAGRFESRWAPQLALVAAAYWLLNPLFVSTTLYLVQRMTLLSALGVVGGCLIYAKARIAFPVRSPAFLGAIATWGACLAFAALSKENGLLLIPITLVLEFAVFRWRNPTGHIDPLFRALILGFTAAGIIATLCYFGIYVYSDEGYPQRDFTLGERLLSQTRFLWVYAGHFFVPVDPGMGIYHDDVVVSRGLLSPPSTLWAILAWIGAIAAAIWALSRSRLTLTTTGMLVFLAGHLMESTFIPLEMYFEHRNYLPGVGLALATAGVLSLALRELRLAPMLVWATAGLGLAAVSVPLARQAEIWSDADLFAVNAVNHHPRSARANLEWALQLARRGLLDSALTYATRAEPKRPNLGNRSLETNVHQLIMYCAADTMPPADLLAKLERTWSSDNQASEALEALATQIVRGHCDTDRGVAIANAVWAAGGADPLASFDRRTLGKLARMENRLKRYDKGLVYAEAFAQIRTDYPKALLMVAYFAGSTGDWEKYDRAMARLGELDQSGVLNRMDHSSFLALQIEEKEN